MEKRLREGPPEIDFNDPDDDLLYGSNTQRDFQCSQFPRGDEDGAERRGEDVSVTMGSTVGNVGVFKIIGGISPGLDGSENDNGGKFYLKFSSLLYSTVTEI